MDSERIDLDWQTHLTSLHAAHFRNSSRRLVPSYLSKLFPLLCHDSRQMREHSGLMTRGRAWVPLDPDPDTSRRDNGFKDHRLGSWGSRARVMRAAFAAVLVCALLMLASISIVDVSNHLQLARYLRRTARTTEPIRHERGIILCMSQSNMAMGLSLIRDLRCHGNNEPIQVYHCFPDEMPDDARDLLLSIDDNLEVIDVCTAMVDSGKISSKLAPHFRSWWIKPLALYHSNIREVLLLDIDDIFMHNPAVLRTTPGYLSTGTTFFFDRVIPGGEFFNQHVSGTQYLKLLINEFDYAHFGIEGTVGPSEYLQTTFAYKGQTIHEQDSSVVAIDKSRAGAALEVLFFLITKQHFERPYSMGDKESFWLAFELAHVPYFFSPWGVGVLSSSTNRDMEIHNDSLCGSIAQYTPLESAEPKVLYFNAEALLDPFPLGIEGGRTAPLNLMFNVNPTHVTPRQRRRALGQTATGFEGKMLPECLVGFGSTPLPDKFGQLLLRRRLFYLAIETGVMEALKSCSLVSSSEPEGVAVTSV